MLQNISISYEWSSFKLPIHQTILIKCITISNLKILSSTTVYDLKKNVEAKLLNSNVYNHRQMLKHVQTGSTHELMRENLIMKKHLTDLSVKVIGQTCRCKVTFERF